MGSGGQCAVAKYVGVGCILRLKKVKREDEDYKTQLICDNPVCKKLSSPMWLCQLDWESYGHPIVVLGVDPGQKMGGTSEVNIRFAKISSWSNKTMSQRKKELNKDDAKDFQLVCVDDDQSVISQYPESKLVLHLEDHRVLKEMSWILCPHHYTLPSVSFETYTNRKPFDRRFEESSYEKLMELFDLPPGKFVATKDLKSQV